MAGVSLPITLQHDPETGLPIAPSSAVWASLSPEEQDRVTEALMAALTEYERTLPPEGTPHAEAQRDVLDRLRRHFDRTRRGIFLATNLMVHYPDERPFAPDLLAVLDVPSHHRMSWVVDREGKGPDFVLEVLFAGDKKKDLTTNVQWFCRLGIPEYFVFDGGRRRLHAWRLADEGPPRYVPVVPQGGRYASTVLGVELAVVGGELKLFREGAPILATSEENALLTRMLDEAQSAVDAEAERVREEAERADAALAALRTSFRTILAVRGWPVAPDLEERLEACTDPARLSDWIARALRAETPEHLDLD